MNEEQKKKYLESGGALCPYCGSKDLDTEKAQLDTGIGWQKIMCLRCNKEWTDKYSFNLIDVE